MWQVVDINSRPSITGALSLSSPQGLLNSPFSEHPQLARAIATLKARGLPVAMNSRAGIDADTLNAAHTFMEMAAIGYGMACAILFQPDRGVPSSRQWRRCGGIRMAARVNGQP